MENATAQSQTEVWVIAGGKGGTGKSFIISSMAIFLARKGNRVMLIDGDIGGANLHSFLGLGRPEKNLSNFFTDRMPLEMLAIPTGIENLSLISGDIHSLDSDSISYVQKKKLFRHILKLDSQYILIDLGAGTHKNVIDTFLFGDKMITVIVPELISVENLYHFVKNTVFRKVRITLKAYGFKEIARYVWSRRQINKITTIRELTGYLSEFPDISTILEKELSNFKIYLILNQARNKEDVFLGTGVKSALLKHLGLKSVYAGYIEYDESVWQSLRNNRPYMLNYPLSRCAKEIEAIALNLVEDGEMRVMAL